jgi:hypothetical protein
VEEEEEEEEEVEEEEECDLHQDWERGVRRNRGPSLKSPSSGVTKVGAPCGHLCSSV